MELKNLLMKRHLTELVRIARIKEVKFDGILTKAEEKAVFSELKRRGEESLLYFYDYAMSGEAMYDDETLPELSEEDFFRIGRKEQDIFYAYRQIEGKWFIIENPGYANDTDTLTEDEMDFFGDDIERMKEENYNFYRKPRRRLRLL